MRPRAYVVDDHDAFRTAASALLDGMGYDVVGSAADGSCAVEEVARLNVDLVLLDLYLPGEDGVSVSGRLAADGHGARVVLVSSREDAGREERVLAAPVVGFLAKRDLSRRLLLELLS